jgi:aspartate/methionine/tyrosine aminotransferase
LAHTRAVVVVHPNNPTGSFVRRDDAAALARFCRDRGLALIADEVFGDFAFPPLAGSRLPSFAGEREALTFVLSGLSKVVAQPQLKLGWIATSGPEALAAEAMGRLEVIADTYLSVSTPVQLALPEILARRGPVQAAVRARTAANLAAVDAAVGAAGEHAPVRRLAADGGWYAVLEIARTREEDAWVALLAREEGVLVHPGYFFDFAEEGYLVVSLLPEVEAFREAIGRVVRRVAEA